ncbi:MAG: hypothetical protein F4Z18_03350 [Caldilineaceae bacterium SB0666_bin_21]|nr:hypothetical protein [Caldilineaceae bacterium SB0666_bin_21]
MDAGQGRWRDQAADTEYEREAERERHSRELQATRLEVAVDLLHKLLPDQVAPADRDRIEESWHRDGPPADAVDRILAVRQSPTEWQSLL